MKAHRSMSECILVKHGISRMFLFAVVFATIFFLQNTSVNAEEVSFDIGTKSLECKDSFKVYDIYGSTKKNHIKINGGTAQMPIIVNLRNGLNGVGLPCLLHLPFCSFLELPGSDERRRPSHRQPYRAGGRSHQGRYQRPSGRFFRYADIGANRCRCTGRPAGPADDRSEGVV